MKRLLFTLLLGLSVLLVLQWRDWAPDRMVSLSDVQGDVLQPVEEKEDNPLTHLPPLVEKQDYVSVIDRPLFLPGRRPPEETQEAETEAQVAPEVTPPTAVDSMDLNAIIITPEGAIAWVSTPNSAKPQKLRIGDEFEGWRIKAITPENIEVEGQTSSETLYLLNYGQTTSPPANQPPRVAAKPGVAAAKPSGRPRQLPQLPPRSTTRPNVGKPQKPQSAVPK